MVKKYGAREVFLGTKNDTIIRNLNSLNIEKQYLMIYNDAFKEVPNGATLTESEIDEYIKKNR